MSDTPRRRWCRHHQKPKPMVDACAIGVDVEAIARGALGRHYMLPCHDGTSPNIEKCACPAGGPEWFTPEEIKAQDEAMRRAMDEAVQRINIVQPLVVRLKEKNREGGSGVVNCPVCHKRDALEWRVASHNKHIAMRCSTQDCIAFME